MAKGDKGGKKDKDNGKKRGERKERNRKTDRYGNVYDQRKDTWTARDKAEEEFGRGVAEPPPGELAEAELEVMNYKGKRGPKFKIAPSVVKFCTRMREVCGTSYRLDAGIAGEILEKDGIYSPSYSSIHKLAGKYLGTEKGDGISERAAPRTDRRSAEITDIRVPHKIKDAELMTARVFPCGREDGPRCFAADGTGQTLSSPGPYKKSMYGGRAKFVHHSALVDTETLRVAAYLTASDKVGDARVLPLLLDAAERGGHAIKRVFADGAYDSFDNWNAAAGKGIEFVVNIRPAAKKGLTSFERNEAIDIIGNIGRETRAILFGYGRRWKAEVFFSVFKRVFGDDVRARKFEMVSKCMDVKYELYNERQEILLRHLRGLGN